VSVALLPEQIVFVPVIEITGRGSTVIFTESKLLPQEAVMENVYVVVTVGLATGFAQVRQLNPAGGDHKNVPLAVPVKVVLAPMHIVAGRPAFAEGGDGYVMFTASVAVPQLFVTVSE